jgi:multiple sugar transport system substrate-binding protein
MYFAMLCVLALLFLTPTPISAVSFNLALSNAGPGHAIAAWIPQFEREYGHTVTPIHFDDDYLGKEILSELEAGTTQYAAFGWILSDVPTIGPYLYDLSDKVLDDDKLRWHDVAAFFKDSGLVYDGKIVALILDGDYHMFNYRSDLLESWGEVPPTTMAEMVELAVKYNGTDMNEDGEPDFGFCHNGGSIGEQFTGMLFMGYYASGFQTKGTQEGVWFDVETLEPLIDNEVFDELATLFKTASKEGTDQAFMFDAGWNVRHVFLSGRCLFHLDWMDVPVSLVTSNITSPYMTKYDSNQSMRPWVSTPGKVATTRPPGSLEVWDLETSSRRACDTQLCPYATGP